MSDSAQRPDRKVIAAFLLVVLLGGSNSVAIRFSNQELPPFWGAALRFLAAAAIFWLILVVRRLPLPPRREALIIFLNGLMSVGANFALLYWGLQRVPAGLATVLLAVGPLLTFLFAFLHGIESFRIQVLFGGCLAVLGLVIAVNTQRGSAEMIPFMLALTAGAALSAEGNVIFKIFAVKSSIVVVNALALSAGAVFLLSTSLIAGEPWHLPVTIAGWSALIYLIAGGSVVMLYLFVMLLVNWSASAASQTVLLFPLVATTLGAWLAGERVTPLFLLGGAIVLAGVWVGAFYDRGSAMYT